MPAAITLGRPLPRAREPEPKEQGRAQALVGVLDPTLVSLAREIAQDIYELDELLVRFGFDGAGDPIWLRIKDSPEFARTLQEAIREWNAADSTLKRIRYKAQASVEASIPVLHAMIADEKLAATGRVEAHKQMSRLAGIGDTERPLGGGGAGGFSLTINMGGGTMTVQQPARPIIEGQAE